MTEWTLAYDPHVIKWLQKADPQTARRIRTMLSTVVATGDPRTRGKALTGRLSGLWRYRIGQYRVICDIIDDQLIVLAIDVGKRDSIYD